MNREQLRETAFNILSELNININDIGKDNFINVAETRISLKTGLKYDKSIAFVKEFLEIYEIKGFVCLKDFISYPKLELGVVQEDVSVKIIKPPVEVINEVDKVTEVTEILENEIVNTCPKSTEIEPGNEIGMDSIFEMETDVLDEVRNPYQFEVPVQHEELFNILKADWSDNLISFSVKHWNKLIEKAENVYQGMKEKCILINDEYVQKQGEWLLGEPEGTSKFFQRVFITEYINRRIGKCENFPELSGISN